MHQFIGSRSVDVPNDVVPGVSRECRAAQRGLDPFVRARIPNVPKTAGVCTLGTEHILSRDDELENVELQRGEIRRGASDLKIKIPGEMSC